MERNNFQGIFLMKILSFYSSIRFSRFLGEIHEKIIYHENDLKLVRLSMLAVCHFKGLVKNNK